MRRIAFLVALSTASASVAAGAFSCASTEDAGASDAGNDGTGLVDRATPPIDAEPSVGDVCGDKTGLQPGAPWPLRGGCPKRAGVINGPGPANAVVKWSLPIAAAETSPAVGADGFIWIGTADGDVLVVTPSGVVSGAVHVGGVVRSSPAIAATGAVVVGADNGVLYGLARLVVSASDGGDASDGDGDGGFPAARILFQRSLAPIVSSPLVAADGTIYVGTTDGKLVGVSSDGTATPWSATTADTQGSSPAMAADGTLYVGSSDKRLYAFAPDGATRWTFETGGAITGSPVVGGDETVYVGSTDGKLYAVSADGKLRWSYATGGAIHGSPAVFAGTLFVGSDDKKLHAVSTATGAATYAYATLGEVATPVIGTDGTVYFGSTDGHVYAVTAASGLLYWAVNVKGRVRGAPAIGADHSLIVTTDTGVVAIGP